MMKADIETKRQSDGGKRRSILPLSPSLCLSVALCLLLPGLLRAVQTPIYTVLSDKGIAGDDIDVWGPSLGNSVTLSSTATNPPPPEGQYSMNAQFVSGAGSTWAIMYLNPPDQTGFRSNRAVDLSAYSNGEIRFWVNCSTDNFFVGIQDINGFQEGYSLQGLIPINQWVPVALPLSPITATFPITNIESPFVMEAGASGTCYVDNVRYVKPLALGGGNFTVDVKNISDQKSTSTLTWSGLTLPAGWARADQYIELQTDVETYYASGWGVQIYTDNTGTKANPKFVSHVPAGQPGSDPAGLVDGTNTGLTLPMAWSIKAGTQTAVAAKPQPAEPNNNGIKGPVDNNAFQWLYMEDLHTPTITSAGTTAFQNGDPFVVVKNNVGNHFGQSPTDIGAEDTPNYIYLEANFSTAVTPRTYQTTAITVEFFNQ